MFISTSGPDEDSIGPEGMEKFCEDIGVEPENVGYSSDMDFGMLVLSSPD